MATRCLVHEAVEGGLFLVEMRGMIKNLQRKGRGQAASRGILLLGACPLQAINGT
jgi:hypothetical protein